MNVACPSCKSVATHSIGAIPQTDVFAGNVLPGPLPSGALYCCCECYLHFRYPRLSKECLDELYRKSNTNNWQYEPKGRKDWKIAAKWLDESLGQGRILDVGCFDGGFLAYLGENYQRSGIEIYPEAVRRAEEKGIRVIGRDFSNLEKLDEEYDAVVTMDVIEHVLNPHFFLRSLAVAARPGGLIIISTGNTDALSWKIMGSRYWYCTIAEHISFINPRWCKQAAQCVGLKLELMTTFSHSDAALPHRLVECAKNFFYRLSPASAAWLRRWGLGGKEAKRHESLAWHPPCWISARDHFITLFRKP
jgi:2-polyprenyl-3-methyl-5-hydroxy-6-metoxy-1,4-benzoquinol methylase